MMIYRDLENSTSSIDVSIIYDKRILTIFQLFSVLNSPNSIVSAIRLWRVHPNQKSLQLKHIGCFSISGYQKEDGFNDIAVNT